MKIAIIPARSGSKRIKEKNIKNFFGFPMIYWPILIAKKSKIFDKIIVSTDSNKIAKIAKKYGAEIPFVRNKKISSDKTPVIEVIKDSLRFFKEKKIKISLCCMIYPTAVLMNTQDLKKGFIKIKNKKTNFVISVSKLPIKYSESLIIKNQKLYPIFKKKILNHSNKFKDNFYETAQFVYGKPKSWLKSKNALLDGSDFVLIPNYRGQDVNNNQDLKNVKEIFQLIKKK